MKKFKRLIYDIETSPNLAFIWRPGSNISVSYHSIIKERKIICICWKYDDKDRVHSLTWDKNQSDKAMLKQFVPILNTADEIIGHNGDRFDLPWIRGRCLYHRIECPNEYVSIDTLKHCRSQFNLNCNRLDYIGQYLKIGRKDDSGGMQGYKKIVIDNNKSAMKKMVKYCKQDVLLLEELYNTIKPYIKHKTHRAVREGLTKIECPECSSSNTHVHQTITRVTGAKTKKMHCNDCGKIWHVPEKQYNKIIENRA